MTSVSIPVFDKNNHTVSWKSIIISRKKLFFAQLKHYIFWYVYILNIDHYILRVRVIEKKNMWNLIFAEKCVWNLSLTRLIFLGSWKAGPSKKSWGFFSEKGLNDLSSQLTVLQNSKFKKYYYSNYYYCINHLTEHKTSECSPPPTKIYMP